MSSKKLRSQTRLNDVERRLELQRQESLRTADRSSINAAKRHIIVAETYDDGNYPPDPGLQQQQHVLPIIFADATFPLTPGPVSGAQLTLLDDRVMDLALCSKWYPPGTGVPVFQQNRQWFEAGLQPGERLEKILWAFAVVSGASQCTDTMVVKDLDYRPFGIFQLPWDDVITSDSMSWASGAGEPINWADDTEEIEWSGSQTSFVVDNPLKICGADGDVVLLTYQGESLKPLVAEVIHKCRTGYEVDYDPVTCTLGYRAALFCSPGVIETSPGDPLVPIIDFYNQTFVTDVGYDPATCSFYNIYQDFCVIGPNTAPLQLDWLDLRDIQDPCCPCPTCPTDCTNCASAYLLTIQGWSATDCECLNQNNVTLDRDIGGPPPPCSWGTAPSFDICPWKPGSLIADIDCVNDRWVLNIRYSTAGEPTTNPDVYAVADPIDMGPASKCPPTGTFPVAFWDYGAGWVCQSDPFEVIIT